MGGRLHPPHESEGARVDRSSAALRAGFKATLKELLVHDSCTLCLNQLLGDCSMPSQQEPVAVAAGHHAQFANLSDVISGSWAVQGSSEAAQVT